MLVSAYQKVGGRYQPPAVVDTRPHCVLSVPIEWPAPKPVQTLPRPGFLIGSQVVQLIQRDPGDRRDERWGWACVRCKEATREAPHEQILATERRPRRQELHRNNLETRSNSLATGVISTASAILGSMSQRERDTIIHLFAGGWVVRGIRCASAWQGKILNRVHWSYVDEW